MQNCTGSGGPSAADVFVIRIWARDSKMRIGRNTTGQGPGWGKGGRFPRPGLNGWCRVGSGLWVKTASVFRCGNNGGMIAVADDAAFKA